MKPQFYLNLEPIPGYDVSNCAVEAVRLATTLNVIAKFSVNGITCLALPDGDPEQLVREYHKPFFGIACANKHSD